MKKILFIVAVATLFFVGCEKEKMFEPTNSIVLKAFTEPTTRASLNGEYATVWSADDKVGLVVTNSNGVSDWYTNQECTLTEGANTTTATFTSTTSYGETDQWNIAAFFPWNGTGSTANNWYGGNVYFKMPESYSEYTSGQSYLPLVADMSGGVSQPTEMRFKHVGAAVKVTINNLPAGAHSIGMKVNNEQVNGDFHISVSDAGTSAMVLDNAADVSKNAVWLNYAPANAERAFTFIFPVPALNTPKLSFQIWDENDILVWEKKLKAQTSNLERGKVLEMPATDITPYSDFNQIGEDWVLRGYLDHNDWTYDVGAITNGTTYIVKGVKVIGEGNQCAVKIKHPGDSWDESWPSGNYVIASGAGTYDIIFNPTAQTIKAVPSKCPYPDANVSLYFKIDRASNDIRFKSSDLGTASWPGDAPVATEVLGGAKFYKWSYPAIRVWNNTVTYSLVDAGNWSLDDASFSFTEKKQAYFFHMDSNKNVTEIPQPVEPKLTIDGSFDDWSVLAGNSYGPNSHNNTTTMKAYVKGTDLFIYLKVAGSYDLTSGRYVRFYFDTDNDKTTGATEWYRKGADEIPTGIDSFLVYFNHSGSVANADIQGIGSDYQLKVAEGTGCLEAELCVPISVLGTITGDTINLFCLGYYPSEFTGSLTSVIVQ